MFNSVRLCLISLHLFRCCFCSAVPLDTQRKDVFFCSCLTSTLAMKFAAAGYLRFLVGSWRAAWSHGVPSPMFPHVVLMTSPPVDERSMSVLFFRGSKSIYVHFSNTCRRKLWKVAAVVCNKQAGMSWVCRLVWLSYPAWKINHVQTPP